MADIVLSNAPGFVLFLLISSAVLVLPGFLIFFLFFNQKKYRLFEILALSFGLSISFLSTLGLLVYLFNSDVTTLIYLVPVCIAVLLAVNALVWWKKKHIYLENRGKLYSGEALPERLNTSFNMIIYLLMIIAFVLMVHSGAYSTWSSDALDHVGTIRDIVEKGQIFPTNAYYAGDEGSGVDPRKGLFHTSLAVVSIISGIEPYWIWVWLPVLVLPVLLCSYYAFAREIFRNEIIAVIAVVLFFLCFEGLNRTSLRTVGYPFKLAAQLQFASLMLFFRYLRTGKFKLLLFSAILGYGIATVHISVFFRFFVSISAFLLFMLLLKRSGKSTIKAIIKLAVLTLIISAVFLIVKYRLSYSIHNPYDRNLRHVLIFFRNFYIADPLYVLEQIGRPGILAFLITPFLYRYSTKNDRILFLFSNMVIAPLIIFNPLVVPPLGEFITTGLVRRIIRVAPYIAVLAFFIYRSAGSLIAGGSWKQRLKGIPLLAILIPVLFPYFIYNYHYYRPAVLRGEPGKTPLRWRDTLDFLEEKIDKPSVILSDPWTSYSIPAFTRHYVTAVPVGHSSPRDAQNIAKIREVMKALNPHTDMKNTLPILNRRKVDYILLNHTFEHSLHKYNWSVNPSLFDRTRRKFERYPEMFRLIHREDETFLYKYNPRPEIPESLLTLAPENPFVITGQPSPQDTVNAIFEEKFRLLGVTVESDTVHFGDSLNIKCYWRKISTVDQSKHYKVITRFDTGYPKNFLYSRHWSKIYRKLVEKSEEKRYRFRSDHNPANDIYPSYLWKRGETILDQYRVEIPSDISPGIYRVKIKFLGLPFGPVYRFSDFISDQDIYDGAKVDSLVILP